MKTISELFLIWHTCTSNNGSRLSVVAAMHSDPIYLGLSARQQIRVGLYPKMFNFIMYKVSQNKCKLQINYQLLKSTLYMCLQTGNIFVWRWSELKGGKEFTVQSWRHSNIQTSTVQVSRAGNDSLKRPTMSSEWYPARLYRDRLWNSAQFKNDSAYLWEWCALKSYL